MPPPNVDPDRDTIRVLRREDSGFAEPLLLTRDAQDVLTTPLLAGLMLPLERIFKD
jgi:hypothetical protein